MKNKKLGRVSIKEALDNLPDGIVFANKNGIILFANKMMYNLYYELSNSVLQNIFSFLESINEKCIDSIFTINDRVYEFDFSVVNINAKDYLVLKAVDITELSKLQEKLLEKNKELIEIQEKIIRAKNSVEKISLENENTNAKMNIHNSMASSLTKMKRLLVKGESDTDKYLEILKDTNLIFDTKNDETNDYNFDGLIKAAKAIGVDLIIKGELPKSNNLIEKLIEILRVSIINAVSHGNASEMYLSIEPKEANYIIRIKNNGNLPKGEIVWGGGFESIKKYANDLNADFTYKLKPMFEIVITVPTMFV